jgi:hypothetical protein
VGFGPVGLVALATGAPGKQPGLEHSGRHSDCAGGRLLRRIQRSELDSQLKDEIDNGTRGGLCFNQKRQLGKVRIRWKEYTERFARAKNPQENFPTAHKSALLMSRRTVCMLSKTKNQECESFAFAIKSRMRKLCFRCQSRALTLRRRRMPV